MLYMVCRIFLSFKWRLLALLPLLGAVPAMAAINLCTFIAPYTTVYSNVNIGKIVTVPRNTPVGTVLATFQYNMPWPAGTAVISCPAGETGGTNNWAFMSAAPALLSPGVYKTPVSGIGMTVSRGTNNLPYSSPVSGVNTYYFASPVVYQFIVTGPLTSGGGSLVGGVDVPGFWGYFDQQSPITMKVTVSGTLTFNITSCSTPSVNVNMGTRRVQDFSGINKAMTPPPVAFNIAINNCPVGINSIQYSIAPNTTSVGNGVVTLDAASTAKGIGVQLLDGNGNPLAYNTNFVVQGVNGGTVGSYTAPLKATYYQTASTVTAGTANTSFTFTMIYQ